SRWPTRSPATLCRLPPCDSHSYQNRRDTARACPDRRRRPARGAAGGVRSLAGTALAIVTVYDFALRGEPVVEILSVAAASREIQLRGALRHAIAVIGVLPVD